MPHEFEVSQGAKDLLDEHQINLNDLLERIQQILEMKSTEPIKISTDEEIDSDSDSSSSESSSIYQTNPREIILSISSIHYHVTEIPMEINGVLTFCISQILLPKKLDWKIKTGISDYCRMKLGFGLSYWSPEDTLVWDEGYYMTGYFLEFIENNHNGFIKKLVEKCVEEVFVWNDNVIQDLTGIDVLNHWKTYQKIHSQKYDESKWPIIDITFINRLSPDHIHHNIFSSFQISQDIHSLSQKCIETLYKSPQTCNRNVKTLRVFLYDMDGVAHTSGSRCHKNIYLSCTYFAKQKKERLKEELDGVLLHELVHVWQYSCRNVPGGLIEGIADYVRLTHNLGPPHWKQGITKWDAGYDTTAFFLSWIENDTQVNCINFVRMLNTSLKYIWDPRIFEILTGYKLDDLWNRYKAIVKENKQESRE